MEGCLRLAECWLDMEAKERERLVWQCPNIVVLCIDSYGRQQQKGRFYHQYMAGPVCFSSWIAAFKQMDDFYDEIAFPYPSVRMRSFFVDRNAVGQVLTEGQKQMEYKRKDRVKMETFHDVAGHRGDDATFVIRVQYRQHASWQGEVTWIDGQKKEYFRSALELVRLIDGALCEKGEAAGR